MKRKITFLLAISMALLTITPTVEASASDSAKVKVFNENIKYSASLDQFDSYNVSNISSDNLGEKESISKALLIGRFDTSDPAGPKFAWSNSTIKANFNGTGISVNLKSVGDNWFNVIVDGDVKEPINVNSTTASPITLTSGLQQGKHSIELVKRTEASQGEVQFLGFTVTDGKLLDAPKPSSKRILFIGDSITAGYGNEGASQYQSFTPKNENAYLSYGALTARNLRADVMNISCSGKGVMLNCDKSTTDILPEICDRVLPFDKTSLWDEDKWLPYIIVINLGTNDFSGGGILDKAAFTTAYKAFVDSIRYQYPEADVYCGIGPLLSGQQLECQRDYVSTVVNTRKSSGDKKIHFIEFPVQDYANGYGEDWHPSLKTHALMANQLTARIKADLGW
jgi:hypothetical protein